MIEYGRRDYISSGYVYFNGTFTNMVSNKVFKVLFSQRFPVTYPLIIKQGEFYDFVLPDNGLYPDKYNTLYELGFGMSGNGLLHIMISNRYYNVLEKPGFVPSEDLSENQYIGGYTKYELPVNEPRMLKIFTLKDMVSFSFRIKADSYSDEKIVLHTTVNRLHIEEVKGDELNKVKSNWEELISSGILRVINSWDLARW